MQEQAFKDWVRIYSSGCETKEIKAWVFDLEY